jgi:hypothetical protein
MFSDNVEFVQVGGASPVIMFFDEDGKVCVI